MRGALAMRDQEQWALAIGGAALIVVAARQLSAQRGVSGAMLASTGAGLLWCATQDHVRPAWVGARGIIVEQAVAINRSPEALFAFWRDLERLPEIIPELQSVRTVDALRSEWVARGPGDRPVRWFAEIINELPAKLIAWRTIEGSQLASAGSVTFEPRGSERGTVVRIKLQYHPPGGAFGALAAWMAGDSPNRALREGLRRFKQVMETGEIATTRNQPRGAR